MDIEKSFRHTSSLTKEQKVAIEMTEDLFVKVADFLNGQLESREKSLCMTKLQEAKFWAIENTAKNHK